MDTAAETVIQKQHLQPPGPVMFPHMPHEFAAQAGLRVQRAVREGKNKRKRDTRKRRQRVRERERERERDRERDRERAYCSGTCNGI